MFDNAFHFLIFYLFLNFKIFLPGDSRIHEGCLFLFTRKGNAALYPRQALRVQIILAQQGQIAVSAFECCFHDAVFFDKPCYFSDKMSLLSMNP